MEANTFGRSGRGEAPRTIERFRRTVPASGHEEVPALVAVIVEEVRRRCCRRSLRPASPTAWSFGFPLITISSAGSLTTKNFGTLRASRLFGRHVLAGVLEVVVLGKTGKIAGQGLCRRPLIAELVRGEPLSRRRAGSRRTLPFSLNSVQFVLTAYCRFVPVHRREDGFTVEDQEPGRFEADEDPRRVVLERDVLCRRLFRALEPG